ncbi:MAG: hypothetical protein KJ067_23140 [Vicinamibacteria bacterium]|nr:hypothetical protein [Vicinamibacteria bacterium]
MLEQAVAKAGGAAALNAQQIEGLGKKIEKLAAQGGQVPASLAAVIDRMKQMREEAARTETASRNLEGFRGRVKALTDEILGRAAGQRVAELAKAIQNAGGVGALAGPQLERVRKEVSALAAEGAKLPASLQGLVEQKSKVLEVGEAIVGGAGLKGALVGALPAAAAVVTVAGVLSGTLLALASASIASTQAFMQTSASLTDLSNETDIATEDLQRLKFIAEAANISGEELAKGVAKMERELIKSPQSFDALGLSVDRLLKMKPEERFLEIVAALGRIPDSAKRSAAAQEIFGQAASGVLRLVKEDVGSLSAAYERLGIQIDEKAVAAGDRLDESLRLLTLTWGRFTLQVGEFAAKSGLANVIDRATEAIGRLNRALSDSGTLAKIRELARAMTRGIEGGLGTGGAIQGAADRVAAWAATPVAVTIQRPAGGSGGAQNGLRNTSEDAARQAAEAERLARERAAAKEREELHKREAESIKKLAEAYSGADLAGKIRTVSAAWASLPPEARETAGAIQAVTKDLDEIVKRVGPGGLPKDLRALYDEIQKQREAWNQLSLDAARLKELGPLLSPSGTVAHGFGVLDGPAKDRDDWSGTKQEIDLAKQLVEQAKKRGEAEADIRQKLENQGYSQKAINAALATTTKQTATWAQTLQNIANQLSAMGTAGGLLGKVLGGAAGIGSMLEEGGALSGLFGKKGKGLSGLFSGGFSDIAKNWSGALAAGMAAFDIGKTIVAMFKKTEAQKAAEDVGRDMGVKISKALAEKIGEDSKRLGDRVAASLKNLKGIIDEAGGIAGFGFDKATSKARDLFSMIQTGKLSVKEAGESFNAVFGDLAEHLEKTKGLASDQFLELMKLDAQYGTQSQAVKDYLGRRVDALQGNLDTLLQGGISTQAGATAIGASLAAAFNQAIQSGASGFDAIKDLMPQIEAFEAQLAEMGLSGGAAFEQLRGMAALAGDEVAGPLIEKFRAAAGAMTELHNMGLLNQETFAGFAAEAGAAYEKLREEGKAGSDAMRLLQPDLQRIWELKKKNNFEVDEATAKLLAEAEAAGIVGEAHMSAEERTATAMDKVASILEKIAEKWGIVTQGVNDYADAVDGLPTPGVPGGGPGGGYGGGWSPPPAPDYPGFASGGAADFGRESVALLHGREAVIPADRSSGIARDVAAQITALMDTGLGREIRGLRDDMRAQQQLLPRAIRDAILLGGA